MKFNSRRETIEIGISRWGIKISFRKEEEGDVDFELIYRPPDQTIVQNRIERG
jgi:hypothetical protein